MEAEGEYSSLRADPWIRAFFNREFAAAVTLGGSFQAAGPFAHAGENRSPIPCAATWL